jgi:SSS family solute:Na+ symporter
VLFLAALPIGALLDLPVVWVIIVGGVAVSLYSVAGGIEADIWTDVVQTFILLGGGLVALAVILFDMPGGLSQIIDLGVSADKFSFGPMEWDLGRRTLWTMLILGIFMWLSEYAANQVVVQRYLAAPSMREARKATILCAVMSVPTWTMFFFLGTCLFAYYQVFPDPAVAEMEADRVFPHFILTRLPTGVAGVIISGVLAAAMSTVDSSINSISSITVTDLLKRYLAPGREEAYYLRAAFWTSAVTSVLMIVGAIIFLYIPKESMVDLGIVMAAMFGGCVVGMFLLGFFTTRVSYRPMMAALAAGILINVYLALNTLGWLPEDWGVGVHAYWVGILVNVIFAVLAYGLSMVWPTGPRELDGLTVWTLSSLRTRCTPTTDPAAAAPRQAEVLQQQT